MPFELHTWGPAFSLPSLDPNCLAAIAYLRLTLPPDTWVLIPSSDVSISPTSTFSHPYAGQLTSLYCYEKRKDADERVARIGDLPALKDGDVVVGGFHNIVGYLARISNGEWDLDSPTHFSSPISRADIIAFQSHIPTHAHPLLSLLLYLSPQNYSHATRPAYTPLLPWPAQYLIPPQRRSAAQTRCEHLGMQGAEFDDDDANDDNAGGRNPKFGGGGMLSDALSGTTPTTQNKKNPTVTSALKSHLSNAQSRLSPTIDALCAPLTTFLSNNYNHNPSTASCLALAYLSLLLIPSLPVSWMQQHIRERYPTLSAFVERGVSDIYAGETDVQEVMEGKIRGGEGKDLPWRKSEIVGAKMAERMIWGNLVDQVPGGFGGGNILHNSSQEPKDDNELSRTSSTILPAAMAITTTTIAAAAAAVAGYFSYTYYTTQSLDKGKKLSDMGEAGALFSALDFGGGGRMMSEGKGEARARVIPVGVEVDVDVSGDGEG